MRSIASRTEGVLIVPQGTLSSKKESFVYPTKDSFFVAKYDIFAPFQFGFTEFHIQSETLREKVKLSFRTETMLISLSNWNLTSCSCMVIRFFSNTPNNVFRRTLSRFFVIPTINIYNLISSQFQ